MCRRESPDPGAALHGTPLEHRLWHQAQQQRVEHRLGALSGMHPDDDHHRTAPPHLSLPSLQTRRCRSLRTPCRQPSCWYRIGSAGSPRPVSHRSAPTSGPWSRTERTHSSHLHGPTCTHACKPQVTWRYHPLQEPGAHLPLDMYMFSSNPAGTHCARIGVMCRPSSPDPGRNCMASSSSTRCGNKQSGSAWSIA